MTRLISMYVLDNNTSFMKYIPLINGQTKRMKFKQYLFTLHEGYYTFNGR